jgi:hypothetical protein
MLTYEIPDRSGSGLKPGRQTAYFDFVVAERPRYIPNSGPPLAPISIMPADDKSGFIIDVFQLEGAHVYLVGFKDNPHLQMSVRPENIRNYVSARNHEQYDFEQVRLRKKEEREDREKQKKPKKKSRVEDPNAPKGKPGRKRKRSLSPAEEPAASMRRTSTFGKATDPNASGPGGRRQQPVEEAAVFASPKSLQKSQGPSLIAPVKGLAEATTDLETDEEDSDSAALEAQIIGEIGGGSTMHSKSPTSRGTSRASSRGASLFNDRAGSSSSKPKTIAQRYTKFPKKPTPSPLKQFATRPGMFSPPKDSSSKSPIKSPYENPAGFSRYGDEPEEEEQIIGAEVLSDEEDSEEEYEVDCILKDEMRTSNDGKRRLYYLIKWEGNWADTWEPAINVGPDPIRRYKEKKRKERSSMGLDGTAESDDEDETYNELFVSDKDKGKAAVPVRGQVIDDEAGDLSD